MTADQIDQMFASQQYVANDRTKLSIQLGLAHQKPVLIEGPAGVGKTEIAKVVSNALGLPLIRLQCYEGLDSRQAIYDWNYQKQLLYLRATDQDDLTAQQRETHIYTDGFLLKRPLLQAIQSEQQQVLLIDEVDRADEEFESYLLEILSDWQISIPEIGTIKAKHIPYVFLTSNRVRELSEALRRRCYYLWIDYPTFTKELEIIQQKIPNIHEMLAKQITAFMQSLREMKLRKPPGIAETLDWAKALAELHLDHLNRKVVEDTLGIVIKEWKDTRETQHSLEELFDQVGVRLKMNS